MKKIAFILLLMGFLGISVGYGLGTGRIDRVRKKGVLGDSDKEVIRSFISSAVDDILFTEDFNQISAVRQDLISRRSSVNASSSAQYKRIFNSTAKDILGKALSSAEKTENLDRKVKINLLLIVCEMKAVEMLPIAENYIDSNDLAVKYLAVKTFCSDEVVKALNETENVMVADSTAKKFSAMITPDIAPEVLGCIVKFSKGVNLDSARKLIVDIAKMRISLYTSWKVKNEYLDCDIITALGKKAIRTADKEDKNQLLATMAQLYSYLIERYALVDDAISDKSKKDMVDAIVNVEGGIISEITGSRLSALKKAIERKDKSALITARDKLLGRSKIRGLLADAIDFYYCMDGDNKIVSPAKLPEKK